MPDLTRAHARTTDPATSHAAAQSLGDLTASQMAVLLVMQVLSFRRGTDVEIVARYNAVSQMDGTVIVRQSPSGIRSRRAELVKMGKVRDSGMTKLYMSPGGRASRHIIWEVV